MKTIEECRLYGILDQGYLAGRDAVKVTIQMLEGGVDIVQLRAKDSELSEVLAIARLLHSVTYAHGVPLIINDHVEIALACGAEGVHVGQDDLPILEVRNKVGAKLWIGKSTHSLEQALDAQEEDIQYMGVGPVFATPTKPDYRPVGLELVRQVSGCIRVPFFAIGGIKLENAEHVLTSGASRIVVVSGILQAENIVEYCRRLKSQLEVPSLGQNRGPTKIHK